MYATMASILSKFAFLIYLKFAFLISLVLLMSNNLSYLSTYAYESPLGGFSMELFHRDSPRSPFYNPYDTDSNRLRNAIRQSMSRAKYRHHRSSSHQPNVETKLLHSMSGGSYITEISIGTPPFKVYPIVDTGSDNAWIQCQPCLKCYKEIYPIFDPRESSTYKKLPCKSKLCQNGPKVQGVTCNTTTKFCFYKSVFGDNSYTSGELATDTFTFDSTNKGAISFPKVVLGCGNNNSGTFSTDTSGILGLANAPLSIVAQLGTKKFSYCALPMNVNATGKLKFGNHATITGKGIVSTPLMYKDGDVAYYMTLKGVSVGNKRLEKDLNVSEEGNIFIDSGSTLSQLTANLYNKFESELKKYIKVKPTKDPSETFNLCYKAKFNVANAVPVVTYHFAGGDLKLGKTNVFVDFLDLQCLSIVPTDDDVSTFGILTHTNYEVEYDIGSNKLSLAPADCTKI